MVRESHEVLELTLKGTLRLVGVDPPKRHDVLSVLGRFYDRLPSEWRETMEEIGPLLAQLARERARAFYGDEDGLVPASELFGEGDARQALEVIDRLLPMYGRLLGEG